MDKPSQTNLYAGLLIYRLQRNVEYLLLNDSFSKRKHWFCPKGQVIGQEDEIQCALRETFETTGLSPKELRVEEGFKIELTYLSGTRPKKVVYRLAQVLDNHARLLPNAEGVHLQWCTQAIATEKVIFKSMQEVFKYAQKFIENKPKVKQQPRRKQYEPRTNGNGREPERYRYPNGDSELPQRSRPEFMTSRLSQDSLQQTSLQRSRSAPQDNSANPLYKTRLCERFETEGDCPYGSKCTFAHGITELRERTEETHGKAPVVVAPVSNESNPLYKTKLCERYMKDKFCQYGPKCHFAHGEGELKERPVYNHRQPEERENGQRPPSRPKNQPEGEAVTDNKKAEQLESSWRTRAAAENGRASDRMTNSQKTLTSSSVSSSCSFEDTEIPTDDLAKLSVQPPKNSAPRNTILAPVPKAPAEEADPLKKILNGDVRETDKSWMKILHLSKEDQAKMQITPSPPKTASPTPSKTSQEDAIIADLKKFFKEHNQTSTVNGKLSDDVKEVTKIEMRNDISKPQLLYIVLSSLLEDAGKDGAPCNVLAVLKARITLFQTFVKSTADQRILLKAWEKFAIQRNKAVISKTAVVLSHWYDCDLVDEDVFHSWYESLEQESEIRKKSAKFIEWLSTAEEEED
ncbi:nudix (nucleoside diphosphate linked moiety X)-type motif 2 [Apophysomyces ossiformis]|uniref:Bis(5'-nucleosyl)-tetraphosphatase [asymmetrical] n=1 Tax=Apophysomyces ossiformis TaxID=679940 RepID=A0A8H7ELZ7_9FUNG|nr:nudix (nucleoside diphosphate linked moiety X)-type motif 2 [Apophysomyces ossiformis]